MKQKQVKSNKCLAKKAKGITLIALVITVAILLILAGVSITVAFGDNGLINYAKTSANKTNSTIDQTMHQIGDLENELYNSMHQSEPTPTPTPTSPPTTPATPTPKQKNAIAKEYGITQKENKTITEGDKTLTIPAGFMVVNPEDNPTVKYADNDTPQIDEGIVIQDGKENQFVWVPVENPAEMYGIISEENGIKNYAGKLYDFENISSETGKPANLNWKNAQEDGTNKTEVVDGITVDWIEWVSDTGRREPDTVSYDASKFDSVKENGYSDFKAQLQKEFNDLVDSVNKYKGFYIGRYETSELNTNSPKVKSGVSPTVETTWYTMYEKSKKIASQNSVTSRMIWGCQWDQVMIWMKDVNNIKNSSKKYINDSAYMGNYSKPLKTTGSSEDYAVKNIYDMAGNVGEWTIEAYDTRFRVGRGGSYYVSGSDYPASERGENEIPGGSYNNGYPSIGSRATLYVNL